MQIGAERRSPKAKHAGQVAKQAGRLARNARGAQPHKAKYDPTWFMSRQHMGPEEAGRAWEILGAKNLVAMHWGTFQLTDEPLAEPPERLRKWFAEHGHPPDRMWIFDLGETRSLSQFSQVEGPSSA